MKELGKTALALAMGSLAAYSSLAYAGKTLDAVK